MNYPENLALQISLIIVPLIAFFVTSKRVFGKRRRVALALVLAFVGGIGAWYVSGYQAPYPFFVMHGPMHPDLVFVSTFLGLLAIMAFIAFIFGGSQNEKRA